MTGVFQTFGRGLRISEVGLRCMGYDSVNAADLLLFLEFESRCAPPSSDLSGCRYAICGFPSPLPIAIGTAFFLSLSLRLHLRFSSDLHDMSPGFARFVMRVFGWRIEGTIPESLHKYIVIAAPHTSWWDFPLGLFARAAIDRKIVFLGKDSLFRPPLGWLMRWLGGYPVDRSKHTKLVDQVISLFNQKDEFAVSLAPEGTRKRVTEFKTGFYYIARGAQVPIICVQMDYGNKRVVFSPPFYTTANAQEDLKFLWNHFVGVRGKRPELSITENK